MKELKLKFKRNYYNLFSELNDRQAGELIKGMFAYAYDGKPFITRDDYLKGLFLTVHRDIDIAKRGMVYGTKGAEILAEKRRKEEVCKLGVLIGNVISAAKEDGNESSGSE